MLRRLVIAHVVIISASVGLAAPESVFNVDCRCGWGGYYRPMEWTPVEIGISTTLTEPFAGSLTVSVQQDGLNTMNITHQIVLTPDMPVTLPLVTKLAFAADKCGVRISDERGRTRWYHDFDLWSFQPQSRYLTVVGEGDLFIGRVASTKFGLRDLPKQSVCVTGMSRGRVYAGDKVPRSMPWDWAGFACLDVLILYNPDWSEFNRHQFEAVADWVSNGGRLLLVLGSHYFPGANAIAESLPFDVGDARQIALKPQTLVNLGIDTGQSEKVVCRPLTPKTEGRMCRMEILNDDACIFAVGCFGFGRVGVLGFDPAALTDSCRQYSSRFWVALLSAVLRDRASGPEAVLPSTRRFERFSRKNALTGDLLHPDRKPGGIELTISGLDSDRYRMTSYHNNLFSRHSAIDIFVHSQLHNRNIRQTRRDDDNDAGFAETEFVVPGSNDVVIEFRPVSSSRFNRRAVLCGFKLERIPVERSGTVSGRPIIAVDFGARGQPVAEGFIGLSVPSTDRPNDVTFDDSDGLPKGVTIRLRPTNADDNLQFNPARPVFKPRPSYQRATNERFFLSRNIEFAEDAENLLEAQQEYQANMFTTGLAQAGSNAVMEYLYDIPEMQPLSIWWVIGLLTALAVLLGPVDYKILKRKDRLPLTWLTCTGWIVLFTAGAYYGVQELRSGKMQVRAVSVVDGVADTSQVWSTAYLGVFAPRSDDYHFEGRQSEEWWQQQWWSAVAPTEESIWAYSRGAGRRNIYCLQHDGYNKPYSVPINIWTIQCLLNESPRQDMPFEASVGHRQERASVSIINNSDSPIKSGYVLFPDNMSMQFGPVAGHESKDFEGRKTRSDFWRTQAGRLLLQKNFSDYQGPFKNEKAFLARGCLQRTVGIEGYLNNGAAVVCVEYENAARPVGIENRQCDYTHVQLVRQVVFPEDLEPQDANTGSAQRRGDRK